MNMFLNQVEKIMPIKVVILGASGMLGHKLFQIYSKKANFETYGTVRKKGILPPFLSESKLIINNIDAFNFNSVIEVLDKVKPAVVINCIGIIKQLPVAKDPIISITINSLLPHRIAKECDKIGARFIHISTDCIFSGKDGSYTEESLSDAEDLYGKSKFLGEVHYDNSVTFRTSIIGHELRSSYGLVEWFISQKERVKGFRKAIFSGFPTVEIARIVEEYIIPNPEVKGLNQISANPISKFDLLTLIVQQYNKDIIIEPDDTIKIDRSLDSTKFRSLTGYTPPSWEELIENMYNDYLLSLK